MERISRHNMIMIGTGVLHQLRVIATSKLAAYNIRRVIELKLGTKNYSHDLSFTGDPTSIRKSISKFKTLLRQYVSKSIPVISLALIEFLQIKNRSDIVVSLSPGEEVENLPDKENNTWVLNSTGRTDNYTLYTDSESRKSFFEASKDYRWLFRYVKYLNYIFRKYQIPVMAAAITDMVIAPPVLAELQHSSSSSARRASIFKFSILTGVSFSFGTWFNINSTLHERIVSQNLESEHPGFYENNPAVPTWYFNGFVSEVGVSNSTSSIFSPSKMFFHLNKGLTILNTLTRKVQYGASAFCCGTVQN